MFWSLGASASGGARACIELVSGGGTLSQVQVGGPWSVGSWVLRSTALDPWQCGSPGPGGQDMGWMHHACLAWPPFGVSRA
jgi:hypothetical protein